MSAVPRLLPRHDPQQDRVHSLVGKASVAGHRGVVAADPVIHRPRARCFPICQVAMRGLRRPVFGAGGRAASPGEEDDRCDRLRRSADEVRVRRLLSRGGTAPTGSRSRADDTQVDRAAPRAHLKGLDRACRSPVGEWTRSFAPRAECWSSSTAAIRRTEARRVGRRAFADNLAVRVYAIARSQRPWSTGAWRSLGGRSTGRRLREHAGHRVCRPGGPDRAVPTLDHRHLRAIRACPETTCACSPPTPAALRPRDVAARSAGAWRRRPAGPAYDGRERRAPGGCGPRAVAAAPRRRRRGRPGR